jgi:hypothetical protein
MPCAYRGVFFLYILFAGKLVILYDLLLQLELVDEIQHTQKNTLCDTMQLEQLLYFQVNMAFLRH